MSHFTLLIGEMFGGGEGVGTSKSLEPQALEWRCEVDWEEVTRTAVPVGRVSGIISVVEGGGFPVREIGRRNDRRIHHLQP